MRINSVLSLIVVIFLSKTEACGERQLIYRPLIINGFEMEPGSFPWHAAIFVQRGSQISYKCGGTLINEDTILTALQCFYDFRLMRVVTTVGVKPFDPHQIIVYLGSHNIYTMSAHTKQYQAKSIELHKNFNPITFENDIAKVKLDRTVTFTPYIQPICLWDSDRRSQSEVDNKVGTVVGWGLTRTGSLSDILQTITVPMVSSLKCLDSNRATFGEVLSESQLCGGNRNGSNICNGDSGGGLYFEENGIWKLRGIISFGVSSAGSQLCSNADYSLFTDIAYHLEWIIGPFRLSGCFKGIQLPGTDWRNEIEPKPWEAIVYNVAKNCCCEATLIGPNSLMTSASCSCLRLPLNSLRIGMLLRNKIFSAEVFYSVGSIKVYTNYDKKVNTTDLAIVNIQGNIPYDEHVRPVGLPSEMTAKQNEVIYVVGKQFSKI